MAIQRLVRPALLLAGGALTIMMTAACQGNVNATGTWSDNPTTTAAAAAPSTHTTAPAFTTPAAATPTKAAAPATASHSGGGQATVKVKANMDPQRQPGDEILEITNSGSGPLVLNGSPKLTFLAEDNSTLNVPQQHVDQPGAATSITLQPGQTAFAGVKLVAGDKSDPSTFVATTTTLTLPGAAPVNVTLSDANGKVVGYPELDLKSVQIGTFQPASQGVNPDTW